MTLKEYIAVINETYQTGIAREYAYRGTLENLLTTLLPKLKPVHEGTVGNGNKPDFIITTKTEPVVPVAYVECKDINDGDLEGKKDSKHKEQFTRYKASLSPIIFTDYLDFHLYENGEFVDSIRIAEEKGGKIIFIPESEDKFTALITRLSNGKVAKITSANKLAEYMAAKARLLRDTIIHEFESFNDEDYVTNKLYSEYKGIQSMLISDLSEKEFADIYAQTIVYGMFSARLHDSTEDTFSREEADKLIPQTNPLLRNIFHSVAIYDVDKNIDWIIDDLVVMFRATNMAKIMQSYGKNKLHHDPLIHFYEHFLGAYDKKLRKKRGVYYTPQSVVQFIVQGIDAILQKYFGLMGLEDDSKFTKLVTKEQKVSSKESNSYKKSFHKVQFLDPATGTGTFLAEIVNQIHDKFANNQGMWQKYVADDLLPRLNAFEIMMASYTIAHLKLDMTLRQTGYIHNTDKRFNIVLTNSLEDAHEQAIDLFTQWLSYEAQHADFIKKEKPVMVLVGNPPYDGSSRNKNNGIMRLMEDYKKEPGGKIALKERNSKWINDDYVKFIRLSQSFINKNEEGIMAFINPHGYLDNTTFRGMRWNLLQEYDAIYVLDLHGNSNKDEAVTEGIIDKNVFDIKQGVCINFFVKTKSASKGPCKVYYAEIFGQREEKYSYLENTQFENVAWKEVHPEAPYYFFVPKDFSELESYTTGFAINELFAIQSIGIVSTQNDFLICHTPNEVKLRISDFIHLTEFELRQKYDLKDNRDWSIIRAKEDLGNLMHEEKVAKIYTRPFDQRYVYYTGKTNGLIAWPRHEVFSNLISGNNVAMVVARQCSSDWRYAFITDSLCDLNLTGNAGRNGSGTVFPLFAYPNNGAIDSKPIPNFKSGILNQIEHQLGESIDAIELFDYIYAILHAPTYRKRYNELLKINYPRIPYPTNTEKYHALAALGKKLRETHLLKNTNQWKIETNYPISGSDTIDSIEYNSQECRVYINKEQYFENISESVWNFYIGGYQPAQKWLKERKDRTLTYAELKHYAHIIHALNETARLMQEIDKEYLK